MYRRWSKDHVAASKVVAVCFGSETADDSMMPSTILLLGFVETILCAQTWAPRSPCMETLANTGLAVRARPVSR
jgi:hypothetical protein